MVIRAKTFEAWMKANFDKSYLRDIAEYGCVGGFPGLTYYTDTCKLYERFKDEIWDALIEDAESYGHNNVYELLASFNGAQHVGSAYQHENLMTWYMAERIAHQLTEEI